MRMTVMVAGLGLLAAALPPSVLASTAPSAQSKACSAKADQQSLTGKARADFHASCLKGAAVPPGPAAAPAHATTWAKAVTAPSGNDRSVRSRQCSGEADRRGLVSAKRESFRLACLASAAPVTKVGAGTTQTAPSPQKGGIDRGLSRPPG